MISPQANGERTRMSKYKTESKAACPVRKTSIGGQALMEGIMMRGRALPPWRCVIPRGEIVLEKFPTSSGKRPWPWRVPVIRGIFNFADSMIFGYRCDALCRNIRTGGCRGGDALRKAERRAAGGLRRELPLRQPATAVPRRSRLPMPRRRTLHRRHSPTRKPRRNSRSPKRLPTARMAAKTKDFSADAGSDGSQHRAGVGACHRTVHHLCRHGCTRRLPRMWIGWMRTTDTPSRSLPVS